VCGGGGLHPMIALETQKTDADLVAEVRFLMEEGLGEDAIARRLNITRHRSQKFVAQVTWDRSGGVPAVVSDNSALSLYDAACTALAKAVRVDEIKTVRDVSEAIRAYARQAKNREMEANAVVLRERAERRLGEKLIEAKTAGQISRGQPPKGEKNCAASEQFSRVTLEEAGIDRKLSSRAQKKAVIAAEAFDAMVAQMRDDIVTGRRTADILQSAKADVQKEARRELQRVLSDKTATLPSGRKMPVIYADPATKFRAGVGNRSVENHYRTMSIDELCELPIAERCLPDCQLFVWSTVPQLANTITRILPAWGGFEYSSHCMWDKTSPDHERECGTGFVFRNQHEVLIYATRGRPPGPKVAPPSIYRERKREHSRKPDYFRQMIIEMTGGLPVLELFARVDDEHPLPDGWESWGNADRTERLVEHAA
jgi:N6-adenosine-specific RNA methylase IME4